QHAVLRRQADRRGIGGSAGLSSFAKGTVMRISPRYVLSLLAVFGLSAPVASRAQVTAERIERAAAEPQNWLTHNGGHDSKRYSTLNQITPGNVKNLEQKWVLQDQVFGAWESNPLVVDG